MSILLLRDDKIKVNAIKKKLKSRKFSSITDKITESNCSIFFIGINLRPNDCSFVFLPNMLL